MGSSLMWSSGLGNLPELELGPQVGWNVLVPSPTRLPSPLRLSSPNRRPLHSQRAAHMNDRASLGNGRKHWCLVVYGPTNSEKFASSLSTFLTPEPLPILHPTAHHFLGGGGSGALSFQVTDEKE